MVTTQADMLRHIIELLEEARLRQSRTESKITQLMLHCGLDPNERKYNEPRQLSLDLGE